MTTTLFMYLVLLMCFTVTSSKDLKETCRTCRKIAQKFNKGLEDTTNKNFGGGNTAWEERKLAKYEISEVRLVEIIEKLCDSSDFECNNMVEEHEEQIEKWWFKKRSKHPDLLKWFCVDTIEVCCPSGTYGPDCLACHGGSERPCHDNGDCDGEGTRGGNGVCHCKAGYKGELCEECTDGYYSAFKNGTHSICSACHAACKICSGPSIRDCEECNRGWTENEEDDGCIDIDECTSSPCKENQYCLNSEGSYSCKDCDTSCKSCTGEGPEKCEECAPGYSAESGKCTDINECEDSEKVCSRENEVCINTLGSYKCACSEGFEDHDGSCVETAKSEDSVKSEDYLTLEAQPLSADHQDL